MCRHNRVESLARFTAGIGSWRSTRGECFGEILGVEITIVEFEGRPAGGDWMKAMTKPIFELQIKTAGGLHGARPLRIQMTRNSAFIYTRLCAVYRTSIYLNDVVTCS